VNELNPVLPETVARRLNSSILRLARRQKQLATRMATSHVEALKKYWLKEMEPGRVEEAFRLSLDLNDKELLWVWGMIEKARDDKVKAWREAVLTGQGAEPVAPEDPEWQRGRRRGRVHGRVSPETIERIVLADDRRGRGSRAPAEDVAVLSAPGAAGH
jgi:hypothetical protein